MWIWCKFNQPKLTKLRRKKRHTSREYLEKVSLSMSHFIFSYFLYLFGEMQLLDVDLCKWVSILSWLTEPVAMYGIYMLFRQIQTYRILNLLTPKWLVENSLFIIYALFSTTFTNLYFFFRFYFCQNILELAVYILKIVIIVISLQGKICYLLSFVVGWNL